MKSPTIKYYIILFYCVVCTSVAHANINSFQKSNIAVNELVLEQPYINQILNMTYGKDQLSIMGIEFISLVFSNNDLIPKSNLVVVLLVIFVLLIIIILVNYIIYKNKLDYITRLEAKNVTINDEKIALELLDKYKQKFITILAHDIINPFNSIIGFSTILKEDFNTISERKKREYIDIICKSASSNCENVRRLFKWARCQKSNNIINKIEMNLNSTVESVLQSHLILAKGKNIKMTNNVPDNVTIMADENILSIIISNFINNAIKFTSNNGSIDVAYKTDGGMVQISVQDTGVGLSDVQLKNLFNPEKNVSEKGTNDEKGFGLGLKLCKELAQLHNGKIAIHSEINAGTTASLLLPCKSGD